MGIYFENAYCSYCKSHAGFSTRSGCCIGCEDKMKNIELEILPCPFCGGTNLHKESVTDCRFIRCQDCSSTGGYVFAFRDSDSFSVEGSIKKWNTRK